MADTAHLAPRRIAGCCHLVNSMAWSQSQIRRYKVTNTGRNNKHIEQFLRFVYDIICVIQILFVFTVGDW